MFAAIPSAGCRIGPRQSVPGTMRPRLLTAIFATGPRPTHCRHARPIPSKCGSSSAREPANEAANNSYCRGIVSTLANDLIGTGPRLQLMGDTDAIRAVEAAWCERADAMRWPGSSAR